MHEAGRNRTATPRRLVGLTLLVCAGFGCAEKGPATLDPGMLAGTWTATLHHAGTESRFVLRFEHDAEGTLQTIAAMPAIDAWSLPFGPATVVDDTTLRIGPWELRWSADRQALVGTLPARLAPGQTIDAAFVRSDPLQPERRDREDVPVVDPLWTFDTGAAVWSGVSFAEGVVWIGNDAGDVLSLDAADGTLRWRARLDAPVRARPVPAGSRLLVHADDRRLHALDRESGDSLWEVELSRAAFERAPFDNFASTPVVLDDAVYVASHDGRLHAVGLMDGATRWVRDLGSAVRAAPAVGDGQVFVGTFEGRLVALDLETGEPVWEYETGAAIAAAPAIAGTHVLVGSRSYELLALDRASGRLDWSFYYWFSWIDSEPNVQGDTAYIGSSDSVRLYAIDVDTGRARWEFHTGGWTWARPAVTDRAVYAATVGTHGYIGPRRGAFFSVDREDGSARWQFIAEAPEQAMWGFPAAPAVGDHGVYVGALDGRLYAFPL